MLPNYLDAIRESGGIPVVLPRHICPEDALERMVLAEEKGLLRFRNDAIGNIITSFDVWGSILPRIEICGTKGSMIVPEPNGFDGEVLVMQSFDKEFHPWPLVTPNSDNCCGLGLSDMAQALLDGRKEHRACGKLALHVLEIMEKIHTGSDQKREVDLESICKQPKPLLTAQPE